MLQVRSMDRLQSMPDRHAHRRHDDRLGLGWAIGANGANGSNATLDSLDDRALDAQSRYIQLETDPPTCYRDNERWMDVMRHVIALNRSFVDSDRMVDRYLRKAYFG